MPTATVDGYTSLTRSTAERYLLDGGTVVMLTCDLTSVDATMLRLTKRLPNTYATISNYFPRHDYELRLYDKDSAGEYTRAEVAGLTFDKAWRVAREWCK